ncbi:prolipoprotein diacylglyceryl transferase [Acidaminococcus intestini]|nr:prolipoprotein diacylglyceryl transferase [Acidaminococcus intestini]
MFQSRPYKRGQCCFLYVMLYSALRFFLEFLRGDYVEPFLLASNQPRQQA